MNKSDFIKRVAEKAEMSTSAAARVVEAIFDAAEGAISEAVHAAGSLSIPGFGKFTKKTRPARQGRNPRTGAEIAIPERTSVGFSAGKNLKSRTASGRRRSSTAAAGASGARKTASASASGGARKSASAGGSRAGAADTSRSSAGARKSSSGASSSSGAKKSSGSSSSGAKKSSGPSKSSSGSRSGRGK
jgi:DNA-binding protein HU-beta